MHFPLDISAILIDLDGTLVNTAPEWAEAANHMLRDMGRPAVSQDLLMSYIGNGISWLVKRALTGDMHAEPDTAHYFETVLSGDSLPEKKPHPMPLLHAAEFFGVRVE
jgi:phosphoglycolate phosphatase-like HAD superfamily hydrolase